MALIRDHHVLVAIPGMGGTPEGLEVTLSDPASWQRAHDWMSAKQAAGWNIYFHPNAVRPGLSKKAQKADIVACDWVQSDIDPTKGKPYDVARSEAWQTVQGLLHGATPPTLIFDSGNGFYPLWRLSEPVDVDTYDTANKGWNASHGVGGTFNADRILKLPGTIAYSNQKKLDAGYPQASQAAVLYVNGAILDVGTFKAAGAAYVAPKREVEQTQDAAFVEAPLDPLLIARVVDLRAKDARFDKHMGSGNDDKSGALWGIAKKLAAVGFTTHEFAAVVGQLSEDALDHCERKDVNYTRALRRAWDAAVSEHEAHMTALGPARIPVEPVVGDPRDIDEWLNDFVAPPVEDRNAIDPGDFETNIRIFMTAYFTHEGLPTLRTWRDQTYRWMVTHWSPVSDAWITDMMVHFFGKVVCYLKEKKQDGATVYEPKKIAATRMFLANHMTAFKAVTRYPDRKETGWPTARPGTWQGVQNGILDLDTGKLVGHTPEFFNTTWIDAPWNPDAVLDGSAYQGFLRDMLVWDDQIAVMQEIFGYVLSGATYMQKCFNIIGQRRCGKGTMMRLFKSMLGGLVYSIRSHQLGGRFVMEGAIDKSLMMVPDVRLSKDSDFAAIAEMILTITGEDDIDVERKGRTGWSGRTTVRLMLLSNSVPLFRDGDGVLASRFIYIMCPNSFYGREDHGLLDKLLTERDVILRWAVEGWQRLRRQQRFTQSAYNTKLMGEAEVRMDPVGKFIETFCDITGDAKDFLSTETLFTFFQPWADNYDAGLWTKKGFSQTLNNKPFNLQLTNRQSGTMRGFAGLKWKSVTKVT